MVRLKKHIDCKILLGGLKKISLKLGFLTFWQDKAKVCGKSYLEEHHFK